jgi:hypothetical protein
MQVIKLNKMKKAIHIVFIILSIITGTNSSLFSQKRQPREIIMTGNFVNLLKTDTGRRVYITYNDEDWFSQSGFHTLMTRADSSGNFKFSLPDLGKPY